MTASSSCSDEPYASIVPYLALDVGDISVEADQALGTVRGTVFTWTLNNSSLLLDWANPTIQQIAANDTAFPTAYNVVSVNVSEPDGHGPLLSVEHGLNVNPLGSFQLHQLFRVGSACH